MTPSDAARRVADVAVAVTGLVVTAPLTLLAGLAVRRELGAGVLYRQERLGRGGHPFSLRKLRTMRPARPGRADPRHDAERITLVGSLLRATSVDELPSLVNLLRGDITLVGPRPLPTHYWPRFRNDEYERFLVRPGITGLAQVAGRNRLTWDERLALDVHYVRTRSLGGDLRLLLRTVPVVLGRTGVDRDEGVTMTALPADRPADAGRVQRAGEAYASSVRSTTRS
jgi:lipopolysaccharide/colanic/teichoic acid biosynthesis glycosyltransferase